MGQLGSGFSVLERWGKGGLNPSPPAPHPQQVCWEWGAGVPLSFRQPGH